MARTLGTLRTLVCCGMLACTSGVPKVGTPEGSARQVERPALCERPGDDAVRDIFCAAEPPPIGSLMELQSQLGLVFDESDYAATDEPPILTTYEDLSIATAYEDAPNPKPVLALLNSSTALPGRLISTINPRAIMIGRDAFLAFSRGTQQLELASRDRESSRLNLYLLRFEQGCNATPEGCSPGDLYTPRVESGWTRVRVEDDEDLKNTPSDCRQCHQRAREFPILLMRELDGPWTHFFMPDKDLPERGPEPGGLELVRAYHRAKGDEPYGNIPWAAMRATAPHNLQLLVARPQPVLFDSDGVLHERWPYRVDTGFAETPLPSSTWYREYEAFKRGEHLPLPYYEPFPSDPDKLEYMTESYRAYRAGEISADELPDLAEIEREDPQTRAEIGLQTEPGATPAEALIQACGACHNDVLDQSISRARFNIDLARMDRAALERAIARIALPMDDPARMPPREFRQLDATAAAQLTDYLERGTRSAEDDALLRRAAELGMAVDMVLNPLGRGTRR